VVVLETNQGVIKLDLDMTNTPKTAENFIQYVKDGFYDGTIFHRVIDGFMIQGGGFIAGMEEKSTGAAIENEADKGGSNKLGSIAMARTSDPHSASAQFFINIKDNTFLDHKDKSMQGWGYCVFGQVTEGMDVVEKIKAVATGSIAGYDDVPLEEITILKAYMENTE
jgi:peptidyl-prolyl cis-trans isomerase B (cyclophilin B)